MILIAKVGKNSVTTYDYSQKMKKKRKKVPVRE